MPGAEKNEIKPWRTERFLIPPEQSAEFVARMEDLLELYSLPHDPLRPVVCLDETPVGLLGERRGPLAARPGAPARQDPEYERRGAATVFAAFCPKDGTRMLRVSRGRASEDLARFLAAIAEEMYPGAERIRLVWDNLNTHTAASLYKAFPAERARAIARRLEIHPTPRHGSWLNMVEFEFAALKSQCLSRRIADGGALAEEAAAWCEERNRKRERVRWTFDVPTARGKLARLYPPNEA